VPLREQRAGAGGGGQRVLSGVRHPSAGVLAAAGGAGGVG
jgi:hypothetical protein